MKRNFFMSANRDGSKDQNATRSPFTAWTRTGKIVRFSDPVARGGPRNRVRAPATGRTVH